MKKQIFLFLSVAAVVLVFSPLPADSCNEAVCASVVSKCMLTQSCKCDLKNCSCCKECFNCLNHLYSECCSCVDMCPKHNESDNALSKKSHVEDFPDPVSALFRALTSEPDPSERWVTYTHPIDIDATPLHVKLNKEFSYTHHNHHAQSLEHDMIKDIFTLNCTVAFISECISWNKCKMICHAMGSSSYRWFHDGCCECIGDSCINYGINESRCPNCPIVVKDISFEEDNLSSYMYDNSREELVPEEQILK